MSVLLCGPVTAAHLADADLLAGIVPSEILRLTDFPPDPMLPDVDPHRRSILQALCAADAMILAEENPTLLSRARDFGLTVYEVAR